MLLRSGMSSLLFSSIGAMPGAAIRKEIPPVCLPKTRLADQARNEKALARRADATPASLPHRATSLKSNHLAPDGQVGVGVNPTQDETSV